jgi:hypothetical protein
MEELNHYLEDERYEKAFESILKNIRIAKDQNDYGKVKRLINYLMSVTKFRSTIKYLLALVVSGGTLAAAICCTFRTACR